MVSNTENQSPNIASVRKKGSNVAKMTRAFDGKVRSSEDVKVSVAKQSNHNVESSGRQCVDRIKKEEITKNEQRQKERRRKIMLQERRMEKTLKQKSESLTVAVERSLCNDFEREATCNSDTMALIDGKRALKEVALNEKNVKTGNEDKMRSGFHLPTFIARTALLALTLYQVQINCKDTAHVLSFITGYIQSYLIELVAWIDSTFVFSGNILVLEILLEIHEFGYSFDEVLHILFVSAFFVRGLFVSLKWARGNSAGQSGVKGYMKCIYLFVVSAAFWVTVLPLYNICDSESSKFCVSFTKYVVLSPRYSWLEIMLTSWYKIASIITRTKIKGRLFKEARSAFMNPFRFHIRLKRLFTFIRWAKFLAPLIGTCNKLRGHILDMIKKKGQHLTSKTARRLWSDLIEALTSQSKQERAVLQLQRNFRVKKESKAKQRMKLISSHRPSAHDIKKRLREERNLSKSKLIKMDLLDGERQLRRQVSEQEKITIAKHEESRNQEKKKLLLSPKTAFAVGWKYVAITCVMLEVSQMIFAPLLSGELKKMPLERFLSKVLLASCDERNTKSCYTATTWEYKWLMAVHLFSRVLEPVVHTVCFLDVFITFFTGELTSGGTLVPKPFFKRFILPGIVLQLVVNPTMVIFSSIVKSSIMHSIRIGPSLCFHLVLVCLPIVNWIYELLLDIVFRFVEKQNKIVPNKHLNIF